ncbi:ribonuclease H-like domain-containing protein [Tanacetum coccineum]
MTDLGPLHYFLGISVSRDATGMFLSQRKYALEILERAGMLNCQSCRTPVDTESKLSAVGPLVSDTTLYRTLKRILRYVRGTLDYGLQLFSASPLSLIGYSDADWATLSCSSAEAEYRGVANVVAETVWLRNLVRELHSPLQRATLVYCGNVAARHVHVLHVPSRYQFADIFTKRLPYALFDDF